METDPALARGRSVLWQELSRDPRFWIALVILTTLVMMALFPGWFTDIDPRDCRLSRSLEGSSAGHPFGFDLFGCDYWANVVYGARTSLSVGVIVVGGSALIGILFGSVAGYFGGWLDSVISASAELWLSVPLMLGGMFILSFIEERGVLQVTLVLTLLAWPATVKLTRSSVLQAKSHEFVLAARALGAGSWRILTRHVIPHSLRPVAVYSALFIATAIMAEAILSFLGVGLQLPTISWGQMLARIRTRLPGHPHMLIPGVAITITVLGFVLLANALRNAIESREG